MKAIVCNDFGPIKNIKYMDVENPEIDDESILINVRSVGVNFPDGLLVTISSGATAVIQPGGSVKDNEVIDAANEAGLAMIFTGMRHFKH